MLHHGNLPCHIPHTDQHLLLKNQIPATIFFRSCSLQLLAPPETQYWALTSSFCIHRINWKECNSRSLSHTKEDFQRCFISVMAGLLHQVWMGRRAVFCGWLCSVLCINVLLQIMPYFSNFLILPCIFSNFLILPFILCTYVHSLLCVHSFLQFISSVWSQMASSFLVCCALKEIFLCFRHNTYLYLLHRFWGLNSFEYSYYCVVICDTVYRSE